MCTTAQRPLLLCVLYVVVYVCVYVCMLCICIVYVCLCVCMMCTMYVCRSRPPVCGCTFFTRQTHPPATSSQLRAKLQPTTAGSIVRMYVVYTRWCPSILKTHVFFFLGAELQSSPPTNYRGV